MLIQGLVPLAIALVSATPAEPELANFQLWWDVDDQSAINKAICDSSATSIEFSIQPDTNSPSVNADGELYVWWPESNDDDCTSPEDDTAVVLVDGRVSDDSSGYFADSSLDFPSEPEMTLTYETVFARVSETFCDEATLVERTQIRLCIGIEHPETDLTGNTGERDIYIDSTSELQVGVDFIVDSTPPTTPTISGISPRDGSIQFDAAIDEETPYLKEWIIRYQEDDGTGSECSTWTSPEETTVTVSDSETSSQSMSFTATNGLSYNFCVIAVDDANNQSVPSETQTGTPRDECDFLECYPGELETGHCGATNSDVLWLLLVTLLAIRFTRTRRLQSC
jgi:hypothetical protein